MFRRNEFLIDHPSDHKMHLLELVMTVFTVFALFFACILSGGGSELIIKAAICAIFGTVFTGLIVNIFKVLVER